MTPDLRILQAVVLTDERGVRIVAQSENFNTVEAERIAVLFGVRPDGIACTLAHFSCPFGTKQVAVVRVEDQPSGVLGFRFLVLSRNLYKHLGDPFAISDRYPANWNATGAQSDLEWPMEVLPERTLEQLDTILKHGDGALLLGSTQVLVDGHRVLLNRAEPAEQFFRELWQLLPDKTRCELWPASFAFSHELGFHASAGLMKAPKGTIPEDAIRDYPQSSYELNLQIAIESGDRIALRKLLARRTSDETLRMGLYMLAFALVAAIVLKFAF